MIETEYELTAEAMILEVTNIPRDNLGNHRPARFRDGNLEYGLHRIIDSERLAARWGVSAFYWDWGSPIAHRIGYKPITVSAVASAMRRLRRYLETDRMLAALRTIQ